MVAPSRDDSFKPTEALFQSSQRLLETAPLDADSYRVAGEHAWKFSTRAAPISMPRIPHSVPPSSLTVQERLLEYNLSNIINRRGKGAYFWRLGYSISPYQGTQHCPARCCLKALRRALRLLLCPRSLIYYPISPRSYSVLRPTTLPMVKYIPHLLVWWHRDLLSQGKV